MTVYEMAASSRPMAKPMKFPEKMLLRLAPGTIDRLKAAVGEQNVAPLVRELIEKELKKRERTKAQREG